MKQYISLENPLCGIGTYKDTLNLDTGATTRKIKKYEFTGQEAFYSSSQTSVFYSTAISTDALKVFLYNTGCICSSYKLRKQSTAANLQDGEFTTDSNGYIWFRNLDYTTLTDFQAYLAQQYANGTPVTVWYVLATPTTSTTTLPRGLSGIVEGSLTQSGTPTPTNPIYPTANSINSFLDKKYLKYGTETDTITTLPKTIIGDGQSASAVIKGNMQQSGTPTPTNPIYPTECGDLETTGEHAGQYKIPILSNSTTTPVYLGEVETTRKIKKLVLTGDENWTQSDTSDLSRVKTDLAHIATENRIGFSSHYQYLFSNQNGNCFIGSNGDTIYFCDNINAVDVTTWKTYLQQQYAAGTPVCVWYVLATPQTAVVNEPIRKIGDYADSVTGTGLPTTGTAETFDVDTTLKPSEVSLTYHGWHEHSDTVFSNP